MSYLLCPSDRVVAILMPGVLALLSWTEGRPVSEENQNCAAGIRCPRCNLRLHVSTTKGLVESVMRYRFCPNPQCKYRKKTIETAVGKKK